MSGRAGSHTLVIRRAIKEDERTIAALARRLGNVELPAWRTADEVAVADSHGMIAAINSAQPDNEVFIAQRDGEPVGCLHILLATDFFGRRHAHVSVLATTAAAEGSGVGRALLEYAEHWARDHGQSLLTLNVFSGNARARRVYERAGFVPEFLKYAKPL